MSDFYTLLKQSIIDRDIRDANDREGIYRQARQAVIKQLWNFHPPLAADEIDTRVGAFDQAVETIEAELVSLFDENALPPPQVHAPAQQEPQEELFPESDIIFDDAPEEDAEAPAIFHEHFEDDQETAEDAISAGASWDEDDARHDLTEPERPEELVDEDFYPHDQYAEDDHAHEAAVEYESEPAAPPQPVIGTPARRRQAKRDPNWHDRWNEDSKDIVGQARRWWQFSDERNKIQILIGAIAGLLIALGAFGGYFLLAGGSDTPTTFAINDPGTVSDAGTAARLADAQFDVRQTYTVFDGRDPTVFVTSPDNPIRFDSSGGFATVSTSISSPGVRVMIGPGLATQLAGERIRITLITRSSPDLGAASLRFAYQSGVARSHWQTANLTGEYDGAAMIWQPPAMRTGVSGDFLLVEPGIPGDGTSADIQSIRIDVLAPD